MNVVAYYWLVRTCVASCVSTDAHGCSFFLPWNNFLLIFFIAECGIRSDVESAAEQQLPAVVVAAAINPRS